MPLITQSSTLTFSSWRGVSNFWTWHDPSPIDEHSFLLRGSFIFCKECRAMIRRTIKQIPVGVITELGVTTPVRHLGLFPTTTKLYVEKSVRWRIRKWEKTQEPRVMVLHTERKLSWGSKTDAIKKYFILHIRAMYYHSFSGAVKYVVCCDYFSLDIH